MSDDIDRKTKAPVRVERIVSLRLTMEEATNLCAELWIIGEDERLTPTLRDVYDRVARAKAAAVQRGCGRAG